MTSIIMQNGDQLIPMNSHADYMKSIGGSGAAMVVMTDESGAVVSAGQGAAGLVNNAPLVKALREQNPIKTQTKPSGFSSKPKKREIMTKSHVSRGLDSIIVELEGMLAKSFRAA